MDASPVLPSISDRVTDNSGVTGAWIPAVAGAVVLGAVGHLLLKLGVSHAYSEPHKHIAGSHFLILPIVLGILMYSGGSALWIFAVSRREISFLYPLSSLTYVFVALGGKLLFNEVVHPSHWAGIGIVMIGIALLNRSGQVSRP
jgi:drug/metabolite transporter (DMT)-like permease